MLPQTFLEEVKTYRWDEPLSDEAMEGLNEEQREMVRSWEEAGRQGEFLALADIVCNCTNKYQFAKTYHVLRKSGSETLADMASRRVEGLSPEAQALMRRITEHILQCKFAAMSAWFQTQWGEDIESYAAKGGGSGCATVLALLFALGSGVTWWVVS